MIARNSNSIRACVPAFPGRAHANRSKTSARSTDGCPSVVLVQQSQPVVVLIVSTNQPTYRSRRLGHPYTCTSSMHINDVTSDNFIQYRSGTHQAWITRLRLLSSASLPHGLGTDIFVFGGYLLTISSSFGCANLPIRIRSAVPGT